MSKVLKLSSNCPPLGLLGVGSTFDGTLGFRLAHGVQGLRAEGENGPAIVQCFWLPSRPTLMFPHLEH